MLSAIYSQFRGEKFLKNSLTLVSLIVQSKYRYQADGWSYLKCEAFFPNLA